MTAKGGMSFSAGASDFGCTNERPSENLVRSMEVSQLATHAVVIGGSLAGMCAARVLSERFDKVTVLERDAVPAGVSDRAGVPQGRHNHGIMIRALREYEWLFPKFERLMLERSANYDDPNWDFARLTPDGWLPRFRSGMRTVWVSRAMIEAAVRDLFREIPNATTIERSQVIGLTARAVAGRLTCTGVETPAGPIHADLVVDASGASSHAPEWFRRLGVDPPRETVVDPDAGYASRWFKGPDSQRWPRDWWWHTIAIVRCPGQRFEAIFGRKENARWHLTIAGFNGDYPPTKEDEFMALLPKLRSPVIAEMAKLMEPDSPVYAFRRMDNRWRHYESWGARPAGFIAAGDAVCVTNPVYAFGISKAAVAARILRDCLERHGPTGAFESSFFSRLARFNRDPWRISIALDLRFPFTRGEQPPSLRLFNWYFAQVSRAAASDASIRNRLDEVMNLLRPASSLFAPRVVARVIAAQASHGLRPSAGVPDGVPHFPPPG